MGELRSFLQSNHQRAARSYQDRSHEFKARDASKAKEFGFDYWDGDRATGYGGYRDDGRWRPVAERFLQTYERPHSVLDIGCGKGFFLEAVKMEAPEVDVLGVDISDYALAAAAPELRPNLRRASAAELDFIEDGRFDLVVAMNSLHNLELPELLTSLRHIQRISRRHAYICVESYRTEEEKWNLLRWQLTCECFFTPREWLHVFELAGYRGDYEFIYF
jgi:protein-L-isoaspartate(D-aspartate) O-methyltransferase